MTMPLTPPSQPARRLSRRWGFWFVLAVGGCIVLALGLHYYKLWRAASTLEACWRNWIARSRAGVWRTWRRRGSWCRKLDNAALRVAAADDLLPKTWPYLSIYERVVKLSPTTPPTPADRDTLRAMLAQRQPAMREGRRLADMPNGRFAINYEKNALATPAPHRDEVLRMADVLYFDAILRAEAGDAAAAVRSAMAVLNAGRRSATSRCWRRNCCGTCVEIACLAIERREPRPGGRGGVLALQRLLEDEEHYPRLLVMVRGERAVSHELLAGLEAGTVPLADLSLVPGLTFGEQFVPVESAGVLRAAHPAVLATLTEAVAIARLPDDQRAERIDRWEVALQNSPHRRILVALLPDLRNLDEVCRRIDARLRGLIVAVATERFRLRHGDWPATLADLTPELLTAVPRDPTTGQALGYVHFLGQAAVFSSRLPRCRWSEICSCAPPRNGGTGVIVQWHADHRQLPEPGRNPDGGGFCRRHVVADRTGAVRLPAANCDGRFPSCHPAGPLGCSTGAAAPLLQTHIVGVRRRGAGGALSVRDPAEDSASQLAAPARSRLRFAQHSGRPRGRRRR